MNIKHRNILVFICLILSSCASNFEEEKKVLLNSTEKKDLVSSFEITKDEARKFNENEVSAGVERKTKIDYQDLPDKPIVKKIIRGKITKVAIPKEVRIVETIPEQTSGVVYPSDYPDDFKKYDQHSKSVWELFRPKFYKGEQSIMAISYLGVTAGYITITSKGVTKIGGRDAYDYYARFKSKEAYRYFYWLDDYLETFVDKENFVPIKYSLVQREKIQNVDDLQLFDTKKLKNYTWYKRVKVNSNKDEKKEVYIPRYVQDSFSGLQFVRGLPLNIGDKYEFPVTTRAESWLLKMEVAGIEELSVGDKDVKAIKIKAETHFPGVLQKSGDIVFWFAADEVRRLLKFQAKVKLGSIYGDLVEYRPGVQIK